MLSVVVLLNGCASHSRQPAAVLSPPPVDTRVGYYAGSPLSGPRAGEAIVAAIAASTASDALDVQVTLTALDAAPTGKFAPLGGTARLIVARRGADPVLPSSQITQGTLLATGDEATQLESVTAPAATAHAAPIAAMRGALPAGVTATFQAVEKNSALTQKRVELRVYRAPQTAVAAEAMQVSLTIEDRPGEIARSETALIDRPLVNRADHVVLIMPIRLNGSPASVLTAAVDVMPGSSDPAHEQAFAQCRKAVNESQAAFARRPQVAPIDGSDTAGFEAAINALAQPATRRAALAYLAGQTDAHICLDTALSADDATLDTLSQTITHRLIQPAAPDAASPPAAPRSKADLAWVLDDAAFELLATGRMNQAGPHLAPELVAVLTLYAGEAGRHGSSLEEITRHLNSRQDLENHLIAENLVFLTDASPSSRVRAYDWLRSRSLAPAGYDPLGPIRQRRESLDKAATDASTPSAPVSPATRPSP